MSFQRWTVWNEDCYYWGSETKQEWHCTLTWWNTWLHGETHISMVIHMVTWWNTYFLVKHIPSWSIKMFAPIFLHGYIYHICNILQLFRHCTSQDIVLIDSARHCMSQNIVLIDSSRHCMSQNIVLIDSSRHCMSQAQPLASKGQCTLRRGKRSK